jgi:hypothetical protein
VSRGERVRAVAVEKTGGPEVLWVREHESEPLEDAGRAHEERRRATGKLLIVR